MKFGTLVRLVDLHKGTQANAIGAHFGIPSGSHFHSAALGLNPGRSHIDAVEDGRIYRLLGGLGLMLGAVAGTSDRASNVTSLVAGFPDVPLLSPHSDMGFPNGWGNQRPWG